MTLTHRDSRGQAALKLPEPSPCLGETIDIVERFVRTSGTPGGAPSLDALIVATSQDQPAETDLAKLVRGVLRSTLEQCRTRQATEAER